MQGLRFSCRCGALTGQVARTGRRDGGHIVCHCADCTRAQAHFGLPASRAEGVDLYQTTPDKITIETGADNLALMRLSPRGLMRWYARCCDTPLFNTTSSPRFAFVGIQTAILEDVGALGPVVAHGFVPGADGKSRHKGAGRMAYGLMSRAAFALIDGRWRQTPFFDVTTGRPVAEPVLAPRAG